MTTCDHAEVQYHPHGRVYCVKCQRWGGIEADARADARPTVEALAALDALVQECYFPHHTPSSESGPEEWDVQIESPTLEALERAIRALAALATEPPK